MTSGVWHEHDSGMAGAEHFVNFLKRYYHYWIGLAIKLDYLYNDSFYYDDTILECGITEYVDRNIIIQATFNSKH